ncbi:YtxH domain-containing protein [Pontibacter beigongshangensis]|uniref:YtxH domain-containing protein n=1 Tax=Pontibacter beigongshangensis TaxID=2574733 RepID=UPI00164F52EA|nr:YtxH domain-containing protein [Pontibacter beigongshangensis]
MKTHMESRSLGESKGNFTNSSVRQMKQRETSSHTAQDSSSTTKLAVGLLAGAGVGVLAGMLLAPEKGKDARKKVAESASKLGSQMSSSFNSTKDKLNSWTAARQDKTRVSQSPYNDLNKPSGTPLDSMVKDQSIRDGEGDSTGLPGMLK